MSGSARPHTATLPTRRTTLGGGAPVALIVVVACLAAGCGTGGGKPGNALNPGGRSTSAATATVADHAQGSTAGHRHQTAHRQATAHNRNGSRVAQAPPGSLWAQLAAKRLPIRPAQRGARGAAVVKSAAPTSAVANDNKTCRMMIEGRQQQVACGLKQALLAQARHNKAVARFLAGAPRTR
jgi:hypothetical protein